MLAHHQAVFVPEGDIEGLAAVFAAAASEPEAYIRKVEASRAVIASYSLDAHVEHLLTYLAGTA